MNVLFIFCEGQHDAQFIGRLLKESGSYSEYEETLKNYPGILKEFISSKLSSESIDSFKIGRPRYPLIPACAFHNKTSDLLVLPIPLGGIDNHKNCLVLLGDLQNVFSPDVFKVPGCVIKNISFLFVFDADSRGREETVKNFNNNYKNLFDDSSALQHATWCFQKGFRMAIFVFTGENGDTGTLEDILIKIFQGQKSSLFKDAEKIINNHFEKKAIEGDQVAYDAKRNKGLLTICGQQEKRNAGTGLTVVLRDSDVLTGAFDFKDRTTQWSQLLTVINTSF